MTDQPKFTKGPWRVDNYPNVPDHPWINATCNHDVNPDGGDFYMCVSGAISQDDAHLIAASPDLYLALDDLLAAYSEPDQQICCNGHECGCRGASIRDMAEHHARAALAKARGEA